MQTLAKGWDSYDATIYTDGATTHNNANGTSSIIVTTGPPSDPRVHCWCTLPVGKWCSSFRAEEKAVRAALNLVSRMSPPTWCISFMMVCQYSNVYKACTHHSKLPTLAKTTFSTLWPRLQGDGEISPSHGALVILESEVKS